jgi:hypothetical protein
MGSILYFIKMLPTLIDAMIELVKYSKKLHEDYENKIIIEEIKKAVQDAKEKHDTTALIQLLDPSYKPPVKPAGVQNTNTSNKN